MEVFNSSPAENRLVLRPKRNSSLGMRIGAYLLLIPVAIMLAVYEASLIWLYFHPKLGMDNSSAWVLGLAALPILICFVYLPIAARCGEGDLILSPEGFEIRVLLGKSPWKYQWTEVTGFYVSWTSNKVDTPNPSTYECICFDKAGWTTRSRQQILSFEQYPMTKQDLADLLNEWKAKYGPNPEGVTFNPIPSAPDRRPSKVQSIIGISFGLISLLGVIAVFAWQGYVFWSSVVFRALNSLH